MHTGKSRVVYPVLLLTLMKFSTRTLSRPARLSGLAALIWLVVLSTCGTSLAQGTPNVQVFGGYSFFRFDSTKVGFADGSNLNGATFAPSYNFTRNFGVTVDGGAYFGNANTFFTVMAGPQVTFDAPHGTVFVHGLFGVGKDRVDIGLGRSDRQRAFALGGGYDYEISPRFSIRVIQVDYVNTHVFDTSENNIRGSAGVVYHWGEAK